jgi:hypothetical protein
MANKLLSANGILRFFVYIIVSMVLAYPVLWLASCTTFGGCTGINWFSDLVFIVVALIIFSILLKVRPIGGKSTKK